MKTSRNCSISRAHLEVPPLPPHTEGSSKGSWRTPRLTEVEMSCPGTPRELVEYAFSTPHCPPPPLLLGRVLAVLRIFSESRGHTLATNPTGRLLRLSRLVLPPPAEFPYLAISDLLSSELSSLWHAGLLWASDEAGEVQCGSRSRLLPVHPTLHSPGL